MRNKPGYTKFELEIILILNLALSHFKITSLKI
jgi:hypothetical protein